MIEPNTVEMLIDMTAPVARVWRAIAEPGGLARFLAVDGAEFEAVAGAVVRVHRAAHGSIEGVVVEASEPHRLSYRLAAEPGVTPSPATATLVELTISPAPVGSRLVVRESGFAALDAPDELMETSRAQWSTVLERLAREVQSESGTG